MTAFVLPLCLHNADDVVTAVSHHTPEYRIDYMTLAFAALLATAFCHEGSISPVANKVVMIDMVQNNPGDPVGWEQTKYFDPEELKALEYATNSPNQNSHEVRDGACVHATSVPISGWQSVAVYVCVVVCVVVRIVCGLWVLVKKDTSGFS